jgi:polysaccharide export outer membrane protein
MRTIYLALVLICANAAFCAAQDVSTQADPGTAIQSYQTRQYAVPQSNTFQESYIFAVGDHMHVTVSPTAELSGDKTVAPDGTIEIPLLGAVRAAGLTPAQLRAELVSGLTKYIEKPEVLISPWQFAFRRVALLGYVGRPGYYDYYEGMRLSELLTLAGGLESYAASDKIKIMRDQNGKTVVLTADMDAFFDGHSENDVVLMPKDIVTIPKTHIYEGAQWIGNNLMPWASIVTMVLAFMIYLK